MTNFLHWKINFPENLKLYKRDKERRKEISEREIIRHQKIIEGENSIALTAYINEIKKYKKLSIRKESILVIKTKQGDVKARNRLIKGNLSRVVWIAHSCYDGLIPMEDLIQEGNIGLVKSVDKFFNKRHNTFRGYCSWWVFQNITRHATEFSKLIRIPVHVGEKLAIFKKYQKSAFTPVINDRNIEKISNESNLSENMLRIIKILPKQIPLKRVIKIEKCSIDRSDLTYENYLPKALSKIIKTTLKSLDKREKKVLTLRFGLKRNKAHTLEEIGKKFNVTRERIRQIEAKALRKLRHPSKRKLLKDFY